MGRAFLQVQALGTQAPAQASAVLGPPNPGAREDSEQSSIPCDASLAAAPGRIRSQPKRKNSWRKEFSLCVCLCCRYVRVCGGGGPKFLISRANSMRRYCLCWDGLCWDRGHLRPGPRHEGYTDVSEGDRPGDGRRQTGCGYKTHPRGLPGPPLLAFKET